MIVWLWDVCGPESCGHGVSDDEGRAKRIAEDYLHNGTATVAKVESAFLDIGIRTLIDGYARTGRGWRARAGKRSVRWERFTSTELAAS